MKDLLYLDAVPVKLVIKTALFERYGVGGTTRIRNNVITLKYIP